MSRFFLLFAFSLCLAILHGQDVVVELSPEFKLPKKQVFQKHLYSDATGHYVYYHQYSNALAAQFGGGMTLLFEKYSPDFKLLIGKEFLAGDSRVYSAGMKYIRGSFVSLFSKWDGKEDLMSYQLLPISMDGTAGDAVSVADIRFSWSAAPKTDWMVSEDTTKLLFAAYIDSNRDKEMVDMLLDVRDPELELLWQKRFKLRYTEEQVDFRRMALGNDGSVYVLAKVYEGDKAKETKKQGRERVANYQMVVLQFGPGRDEPAEYRLNLSDAFVKDASLNITPQGDVSVVGFFANDYKGLARGAFLMKLHAGDGEVLLAKKKEFSSRHLELMGDDNTDSKKGEEGLGKAFRFQNVLFLDNGKTFITAEENYTIAYSRMNANGAVTTRYTYYSKDIIALLFDAEGDLEDIVVIPKRQRMKDTNFFLGFATLQGKDKAYFFYNEDRQNLKKPIGERTNYVSNFNDGISVVTTVDAKGNLERTPLFDVRDVESLFVADLSSQIDESSLFFCGHEAQSAFEEQLPDGQDRGGITVLSELLFGIGSLFF